LLWLRNDRKPFASPNKNRCVVRKEDSVKDFKILRSEGDDAFTRADVANIESDLFDNTNADGENRSEQQALKLPVPRRRNSSQLDDWYFW
jgi:hypothetical protein